MRCEDCQGTGWKRHALSDPWVVAEEAQIPGQPPVFIELVALRLPCPGCGGSGISSCCEGATGCASEITNGYSADAGRDEPAGA